MEKRNIIDRNFVTLENIIKVQSEEEIYESIVNHFNLVNQATQASMQKFFKEFAYWGDLDIEKGIYDIYRNKAKFLKNRLKDIGWLYSRLKDAHSKFILYSIISNTYFFDFGNLAKCMDNKYCHYFDLDILPYCCNEVFVDLGAYTGDSIKDFIQTYGANSYKKIYAYEMTKANIQVLKNNLEIYTDIVVRDVAVGEKKGHIYYEENAVSSSANVVSKEGTNKVECVCLDEDISEKISIVKMDIEGAEKDAIKGMKNHIVNDKPVLMLSVYHTNEDIVDIPLLIESISKDYDYYLRYYGGAIYPTEIVLICVPKK